MRIGDKGVAAAGRRERYAVETFNFTHSKNKMYSDDESPAGVGRGMKNLNIQMVCKNIN